MAKPKFLRKFNERAEELIKETSGVKYESNLSSWEEQFLRDIAARHQQSGSDKQMKVMASIELKVFGVVKDEEPCLA